MDLTEATTLFSPAKVNLGLAITGRRSDHFHLLSSLFWPLDFGDTLYLAPSKEIEVTMEWDQKAPFPQPLLPEFENNLVTRLLRKLQNVTQKNYSVRIQKQIPMGGGLGGGSSNAGTLLRWFTTNYRLKHSTVAELAVGLGADVPFFLSPQPTLVRGIGEQLDPLHFSDELYRNFSFLVLIPPVFCPTAEVFRRYKDSRVSFSVDSVEPLLKKDLATKELVVHLKNFRNDLEEAAISVQPSIRELLAFLRGLNGIYSGLSGSGSACLAVFESTKPLKQHSQVILEFCRKNGCRSITAHSAAR